MQAAIQDFIQSGTDFGSRGKDLNSQFYSKTDLHLTSSTFSEKRMPCTSGVKQAGVLLASED